MSKFNENQFEDIIASNDMDDEDYLSSFVECDNCGNDVHMDDAIAVNPTAKERKKGNVSNFYCGPTCRDLHQSSPRKGMIGNPFVQLGWDVEKDFKKK